MAVYPVNIAAVPFFDTDYGSKPNWSAAAVQMFSTENDKFPDGEYSGCSISAEFQLMRDRSYMFVVWQDSSATVDGQPTKNNTGNVDEYSKILMIGYTDNDGFYRYADRFYADKDFKDDVVIYDSFSEYDRLTLDQYAVLFPEDLKEGDPNEAPNDTQYTINLNLTGLDWNGHVRVTVLDPQYYMIPDTTFEFTLAYDSWYEDYRLMCTDYLGRSLRYHGGYGFRDQIWVQVDTNNDGTYSDQEPSFIREIYLGKYDSSYNVDFDYDNDWW